MIFDEKFAAFDNIYNYQSEDSDSDDVSIEVSLIDEEEEAEGSEGSIGCFSSNLSSNNEHENNITHIQKMI